MAFYRLEDDLGYSPSMRPLDERRVFLDRGGQLCPLEVEHRVLRVPKLNGGPQEDSVHRDFNEPYQVSNDALNEGAIHRAECPPDEHDFLPGRCDRFEPKAGSRAVHAYLDRGDVGSMFPESDQRTVLSMNGGSYLKGVNFLKLSEDLWGPVRWHSRLDLFPYSEPLTNIASYFGARGISNKFVESWWSTPCANRDRRCSGLLISRWQWTDSTDSTLRPLTRQSGILTNE
ncbi:hypothetical protein CRG98_002340 [Punica granatum]|uniref:Uncharacterized protein n=1 Tax=Punica granatum TaxID=22663 RepID=A0A2I0L9B5_PUNGR|nr:hypothetical protein CRG98_002340 [Punica granatum]